MRILAIDLGTKRTGVAVGDDRSGLVSPVAVITAPPGEALLAQLAKTIETHGPDALLLGLPLNMDGSEGPAAGSVRAFGARLAERTRLEVHYQDERLTSFDAEQLLAGSGLTHKRKKELRDALAAAAFLRDWLARRREEHAGDGDPGT